MSTVITSLILIAVIIGLMVIFKLMHSKSILKKREKMASSLSHAGTQHGLSFTSQELLHAKAIGVDGIHRKFLIVNEKMEATVVALDEVKNCEVKKEFETLQYGDPKKPEYESHLATIELVFAFSNKKNPVKVVFFNHLINRAAEAPNLEAKAKDWEIILSKMIAPHAQERA